MKRSELILVCAFVAIVVVSVWVGSWFTPDANGGDSVGVYVIEGARDSNLRDYETRYCAVCGKADMRGMWWWCRVSYAPPDSGPIDVIRRHELGRYYERVCSHGPIYVCTECWLESLRIPMSGPDAKRPDSLRLEQRERVQQSKAYADSVLAGEIQELQDELRELTLWVLAVLHDAELIDDDEWHEKLRKLYPELGADSTGAYGNLKSFYR